MSKRDEEYTHSGVGWIGDIPKDWATSRIKFVCTIVGRIGFRGYTTADLVLKGEGAISLSPSNIKEHKFNIEDCTYISWEKYEESPEIKIFEGDILVVKTGSTIGKIAIVPGQQPRMTLNPQLVVLKKVTVLPRFLYYLMTAPYFQAQFEIYSAGGSTPAISQEKINNFYIAFPRGKDEQKSIVSFLDHKTSLIDTLISKKEKLIELLQEERTAIINQAVTKGIDTNAPMKDSGIEWLGEIPEHWEVKRLKYLTQIRYGLGQPPKQKAEGLPIIRATNIYRGVISEENMLYVDPDDLPMERNPILKLNEIIVVRSGAYTADSAIITKRWTGAVTGYDMVITPIKVNPRLLSFALLSTYMLENQLFVHRLRAAQPHLNSEELGNTFMLLPPIGEQKMVVNWIKNELGRIQTINEKIRREIDLLKEYKTALISEVVTGKIDVRNGV